MNSGRAHVRVYEQPLDIRVAQTSEEIESMFQLRYRVYVERLRSLPENTERLERDTFDGNAIHIGAWLDKKLAGCMRLLRAMELTREHLEILHVKPEIVRLLMNGGRCTQPVFLMELQGFVLPDKLRRWSTVELSRFIALEPGLAILMLRYAYDKSRTLGFTDWVYDTNRASCQIMIDYQWKAIDLRQSLSHHGDEYTAWHIPLEDRRFRWNKPT